MPGSIIYDIEFTNVEGIFVKATIEDNAVQTEGTPQVIKLTPAASAIRVSTIDEGENKFTPVKSQQATISFLSDSQYGLETFADGPDDRFGVTVLYGTTIIFYGFLSLNDNSAPFLSGRNTVTLTANDKLAALKDIPLTDANGDNPEGKYTIAELVAMCLKKTGLNLQLRVLNNLRHGSGRISVLATFTSSPNQIIVAITTFFYIGQKVAITGTASNNIVFTVTDIAQTIVTVIASDDAFVNETEVVATFTDDSFTNHFYDDTYLDAKTFEEEIGVSENCYTVLEKILGYDCFLTQYQERWWICRVDEFDSNELRVARFDADGNYVDQYYETNLVKNIGFTQTHYFSQEQSRVSPTRPLWFVKLTYNFTNPEELVCNMGFDRGDVIDEPDLADPTSEGTYELDCWTKQKFPTSGTTIIPADNDTYIVRRFEYGYEKEKYINMTTGPAAANEGVMSQPVPVKVKDKINVSVDWRLSGNVGSGDTGANVKAFNVLIITDSGDYYYLDYTINGGGDPAWTGPFDGQRNQAVNYLWDPSTTDETEWQGLSVSAPAAPVSGMLYIGLFKEWQGSGVYEVETHFSNLEVSVTPIINGSYQSYRGRYDKIQRAETGYLATLEDEVYISDAERELFKGAMFWLDGSTYKLTVKWFDASKSGFTFPTDLTTVRPFGEHQAFAVWNQFRLANSVLEYSIQGLGGDVPSLVHKYGISDMYTLSNNRKFLMLTKDVDLQLCELTGVIDQAYNTVEEKVYTDEHEFKYIS